MLDTLHQYLKFDVNHLDANGQTLLFYAAKAGMNSLIGHIVKDLGANPNIIDNLVGQTAIFYAAAYGKCETVEFLARLGADVNFEDLNGQTPLIYAVVRGHLKVVDSLVNTLQCETQTRDARNLRAIDHAKLRRQPRMIALLKNAAPDDDDNVTINKSHFLRGAAHKKGAGRPPKTGNHRKEKEAIKERQTASYQQATFDNSQMSATFNNESQISNSDSVMQFAQPLICYLMQYGEDGECRPVELTPQHIALIYKKLEEIQQLGLEEIPLKHVHWTGAAFEALETMMSNKNAECFLVPVDPIMYNIPDYFQKIKRPMDLGTIQSKLERNLYPDLTAFITDVNLVFNNCTTYNSEGNWAHNKALIMKREF